jgi:hypothetical protein
MGITQQIGASSIIKPGVIDNTAARPASPYEGQVIFQKDTDQLLVWNGTAWVIPNSPAQNPQGLELIKTQTVGSAVSSVVVSDAFSTTYENYKITMNSIGSASHSIALSLGASVTGYYGVLLYADSTVGTSLVATRNNAAQMNWVGGCAGNGFSATASFELLNPFSSAYTKVVNGEYQDGVAYGIMQGEHRVASSYTSFTLTPTAGTITGGTIFVYGYRKA